MSRLSPGFVRITLSSPELEHFSDRGLDQRVKLVLPLGDSGLRHFPVDDGYDDWSWWQAWRRLPADRRNPIRTYTARAIRPLDGEIDIDFVCHGETGPASAWALRAAPGDEVIVVGPDSRCGRPPLGIEWRPGDAGTLLLAGDETAVPAIAAILQSLGQEARGCAILEIPTRADILPLDAPDGIEIRWLPRDETAQHGEALVPAVQAWVDQARAARRDADAARGDAAETLTLTTAENDDAADSDTLWDVPDQAPPTHDLYAFLAGEAGAITTLRRHLVGRAGLDRSQVAFMGYWRQGRAES